MDGSNTADPTIGPYYNPPHARDLRRIPALVESFRPFVEAHRRMPRRVQTVALRLLWYYLEYCERLSGIFAVKCFGATNEAERLLKEFLLDFGKYELGMQQYYDHFMMAKAFERILCREKDNIPGL